MNGIVRLLAVSALLGGASLAPARAWQAADPDAALIDLAPQRYAVPDVPRDVPSDVPSDAAEAGDAADVPDASGAVAVPGLRYDLLFLDEPGHGTVLADCDVPGGSGPLASGEVEGCFRLRWFGSAADPAAGAGPSGGFGPLASGGLDAWTLGARNWRYRSSAGYGVTLGSTAAGAPDWGRPVRLAGVGVARSVSQGRLPAGSWDYAVALGAVDTGRTPAEGDLAYGPVALDATTRYAPDRDLILASRLQSAQGLTALGLGGDYSMGGAGAWRFGVSGSRQPLAEGWRRQLGYTLGLLPGWDLSWVNARQGGGYADLAAYGGDPGCDCVSNQWQLDLAAGRWGSFSGSFERRLDAAGGGLDERVGLAHGFRYGPYLRVRLETNRNLTSGDYGLGARFSLPLDW